MASRQLRPRRGKSVEPNGQTSESPVKSDKLHIQNLNLPSQTTYTIGKHDGNNLQLPAALISKQKAIKSKKNGAPLHIKIYDWLQLQYLRYETTTGLYMTVFWEKCILSKFG
jgi:hypothetical protein